MALSKGCEMKDLYTIGRWTIHAQADGGNGSVDFTISRGGGRIYIAEGFIRDSWFRRSIHKAFEKAVKEVNKRHKKDLESQAGMEVAENIAENWLSEPQIEKLLEEVLST